MAAGADRHAANPHTPPVRIARWDSLSQSRATGSDLPRLQSVSGGAGRIFPAQETAPSFSTDGYPAEKSVIASGVTTCNTSRNTRGRWSARDGAVDHAAC